MEPSGLIDKKDIPEVLPVLPLRGQVFFPGAVLPISVGREKTRALLAAATKESLLICVVTQRRTEDEDPGLADLYGVGTLARIVKSLKVAPDTHAVVIQGLARLRLTALVQTAPYLQGRVEFVDDSQPPADALAKLGEELKATARKVILMMPELPAAAVELVESVDHPGHLADLVAANVDIEFAQKQGILETFDLAERLKKVTALLQEKMRLLESLKGMTGL
jgi:ATP-dependent Lon protease